MIDEILHTSNERMNTCVQTFQNHVDKIRTGRASPELLHGIYIEYFGSRTSLQKVANIIVEDSHTLKINVFDESCTSAIKKAILNSNLDLNPVIYGKDIRVPLPSLTEERRKKLIKAVRSDAENSRVLIRSMRRDANDQLKNCLKNKSVSEDNEHTIQNKIQKITDKHIKSIDNILLKKEQLLMKF